MPAGVPPCRVASGARSASGWSSPDGSGSFHSSACVERPPRTRPSVSCLSCSSRIGLCLSLPRSTWSLLSLADGLPAGSARQKAYAGTIRGIPTGERDRAEGCMARKVVLGASVAATLPAALAAAVLVSAPFAGTTTAPLSDQHKARHHHHGQHRHLSDR